MKQTILIFTMIFGLGVLARATEINTTFKVYGNCDMCKARIEKAVKKLEGIKSADWNKETKMITLAYDDAKVSLDDIHKKIVSAGHDTDKLRAEDKVYQKLHECCQYDRNPDLKPAESKNESSIKTVKYNISGMTCEKGCANRIENSIYKKKGVKECDVNFDKKTAIIVYDEKKITKEELVKVIEHCSAENESIESYKAVEIKE